MTLVYRLAAAAASLLLGQAALAYDATADFSASNNPNGVWTYGSAPALNGSFAAYSSNAASTATTTGSMSAWSNGNPASVPWLGKAGASGWTCCGTVVVPTNTLTMHPGAGGEYSVVRFISPAAATYQVNASFWAQDTVGTNTDVHVYKGAGSLWSAAVVGTPSAPDLETFSGLVTLAVGEALYFKVGAGGSTNGSPNYFFDSTGFNATVTAVPEPMSAALLLAGLGAVTLVARRRMPNR
jgi:hypothetical protein